MNKITNNLLMISGGLVVGLFAGGKLTAKCIEISLKEEIKYYDPRVGKIIFNSKKEAEEVLNNIVECIDDFGCVSISDLYDIAGFSCQTQKIKDTKYGWKDTKGIYIQKKMHGYQLRLPKATLLD